MLGAEHPDPGLAEQRFMDKRLGYPSEAADGEIDAPGEQRLGNPHIARPDSELGVGRQCSQSRHKSRHQHGSGIFGASDREATLGSSGIEFGWTERQLELKQTFSEARSDFGGAHGRPHSVRHAHKEFVVQRVAQPAERMTDRRLAKAEAFPRPRDAAFLDQRVEYPEEVQIQRAEMNIIHECDAQLSFACKFALNHSRFKAVAINWRTL